MKDKFPDRPKVGIGVIIQNTKNKILIGKIKGSHIKNQI